MADGYSGSSGGGNTFLAFVVGILLVVVVGVGFYIYAGQSGDEVNLDVKATTPSSKVDVDTSK